MNIDPDNPNTGNVRLDGVINAIAGMAACIGWLAERVTDGELRGAHQAHLSALSWAIDAERWASRLERTP